MNYRPNETWIPDRSQPRLIMTVPTAGYWGVGGKYATGVTTVKKISERENISIGTWNVRTLRPAGSLKSWLSKQIGTNAHTGPLWNAQEELWWDVSWWQALDLFQWRGGQTWGWVLFSRTLSIVSAVLGTNLNSLESSSFQCHHHTGLCTNIWTRW